MSVATFTKTGSKATTSIKLNPEVFNIEVKSAEPIRLAYEAQLATQRSHSADTLTRGLVRGGGRKPHRQKGTGRARAGSIRSPLWRGGGITFGPSNQANHSFSVNKKVRKAAFGQALSLKAQAEAIILIEPNSSITEGKTKSAAALIDKIGARGRIIWVVAEADRNKYRAINNLQDVQIVSGRSLSVRRIVDADTIVIEKDALEAIEQRALQQQPEAKS